MKEKFYTGIVVDLEYVLGISTPKGLEERKNVNFVLISNKYCSTHKQIRSHCLSEYIEEGGAILTGCSQIHFHTHFPHHTHQ